MNRLFLFTCWLCVACAVALAQDVVTVSGGAETHKVLVDNPQVRVLDVHVPPGLKIAMHSHPASVVYCVTDAQIKFTYPDGTTKVGGCKAGTAAWRNPETHAAENVGTAEFHLVQTEMKGETAKAATEMK
jgi:quercetin dioxygenase-like cupin family protein